MTRDFDEDQSPLWVRSELVRTNLLRLTTYLDRANETVDRQFYFSQFPVVFDFAEDGEAEFWPVVQKLGPLAFSINHLPSPEDAGLLARPWSFTLANVPWVAPPVIQQTLLTSALDETDGTSFATPSVSPSADVTLLACFVQMVALDATPTTPTCSGCGLSWTEVETIVYDDVGAIRHRLTVFRASGSAPTPGAITFDCGAQTAYQARYSVHEFPGTDTSTTDGVVQSGQQYSTSEPHTVTLAAFASASNAAFGAFARETNGATITATDGYERVVYEWDGGAGTLAGMFKPVADTTVTATGNAVGNWGAVAVELAQAGPEPRRLCEVLRDHTLENARIEWTQIALAEHPTTVRIDLSALVGDEHTFWYLGRIRRVGPISNESIVFDCATELPEMGWVRSPDATVTQPDHVGKRWPKVAGEAKGVPCINHDVGFLSTLAASVENDATTLELTDSSGFGSTGKATIGGEVVEWSDNTANILTVTRGIDGSVACNHAAGDLVVEVITTALFGVADHEVNAVGDVHAMNPYSGHKVRLTTAFTKNVADTVDGETRATLEFTQEQLADTLRDLAASPEVTDDGAGLSAPPTTMHPLSNTLGSSGITASEVTAVVDGMSASTDPYCTCGNGDYFYVRFWRAAQGFDRQHIKMVANLTSGSGSWECYKGRYGIDTGSDLVLLQTEALSGGHQTYTCETTENANWVTFRFTGTPTVRVFEVYQLTDYTESASSQSENYGKYDGGSEVSSGNWFDNDDGTSISVGGGVEWIGVRFISKTYSVQRIRILMGNVAGYPLQMYVSDSDYNSGGSFAHDSYTPNQDSGNSEFIFETSKDGKYVTFDKGFTYSVSVFEIERDYVTYTYAPGPSLSVAIKGASIGYNLTLLADVAGYEVPAGATPAYKTGAAGTLIKLACDVLRYLIEEIGGETVDTTSYDSAYTNLGGASGVEIACDLRTMGNTWEEIVQRAAFESRVTLVPEETASGRVWKMLTADTDYEFPAADGEITEWAPGGFNEVGRALRDELATRFTFFHTPDWTRGEGEEAYTGIVVANEDDCDLATPDASDLATAVLRYGSIEATPFAFRALRSSGDAIDVGGYYSHELIRGAALFAIKDVPWWEGFDVQVGDILETTPPWASSAVKCRVIEYIKDPDTELVELRLVEVE